MKTTIEIPELLFRRATAAASEQGRTLNEIVNEALKETLTGRSTKGVSPWNWMRGFGKLRRLHRETARVQARIDEAFETVPSSPRGEYER